MRLEELKERKRRIEERIFCHPKNRKRGKELMRGLLKEAKMKVPDFMKRIKRFEEIYNEVEYENFRRQLIYDLEEYRIELYCLRQGHDGGEIGVIIKNIKENEVVFKGNTEEGVSIKKMKNEMAIFFKTFLRRIVKSEEYISILDGGF